MTTARAGALLALGFSSTLFSKQAGAQAQPSAAPPPPELLDRAMWNDVPRPDKVTGLAELDLGWLALPVASVCGDTGCARGDSSPWIAISNLVRFHRHFAAGASVGVAPFATTQTEVVDEGGVDRRHARGYLTIEALGRYYFLEQGTLEPWLGLGVGLVVMSDTFVSADNQSGDSYIGSPGVTLSSEGLSTFAAGGFSFFADTHFRLGATARAGLWLFPSTPAQSPFLDRASLTGPNLFLSVGVTATFHADL